MTPSRDDVIRWMDAAELPGDYGGAMRLWESDLARFAAVVARAAVTAERVACAQLCDRLDAEVDKYPSECAAAIRARSTKP